MSFSSNQTLKQCLDQLDTGKQDKVTASGLLKGDSAGNVSAADATALKALLDKLPAVSPAAGDKIPLADISGGTAGFATISDVLGLSTQIATGSYTGTGTYGSANPCSLTFPFIPQIVFVSGTMFANGVYPSTLIAVRGKSANINVAGMSNGGAVCPATWSGNNLSWYTTDSSNNYQLNASGAVYRTVALG